jgi:Nuclease A inhibitor-like protein
MKTDEQLFEELKEATRDLLFMSESDFPLEPFRWEAEPTPDFLRGLTGDDASAPIEEQSVAEFFRAAASEPDWKGEAELATARRFQSLRRLLEENLTALKVLRVGTINIPVYVVGRGPSGDWLGVSTRVVET